MELFKAEYILILLFMIICLATLAFLNTRQNHTLSWQYLNNCNDKEKISKQIMLDSGWDDRAYALYQRTSSELRKNNNVRVIKFPVGGLTTRIINDAADASFWNQVEQGTWESATYSTFLHYISSDTVVIDFGTWIGPTILFSGQLAARAYGIEADPVAFSKVSYHLKRNVETPWYSRIHLHAACVGTESTLMEMKGANAGDSMSSMHKFYQQDSHRSYISWMVRCYRLSEIFTKWNIDSNIEHVFIKIDIESYECKLLPSLYPWLVSLKRKPTLYIAMHSQIVHCENQEYEMIAKVAALYRFRSNNFVTENNTIGKTGEYVLSDVIPPP